MYIFSHCTGLGFENTVDKALNAGALSCRFPGDWPVSKQVSGCGEGRGKGS